MSVQDFLQHALVEHEALQSQYAEAVSENRYLRTCLGQLQTQASLIATSPNRQFSTESVHNAVPPSDNAVSSKQGPVPRESGNLSRNISFRNRNFLKVHHATKAQHKQGSFRHKAESILNNSHFEAIVACAVCVNVVFMWFESDIRAAGNEVPTWLAFASVIFFALYCFEFGARCIASRMVVLADHWNKLDLAVLTLDAVTFVVNAKTGQQLFGGFSVQICRLIRVFRLTRIVKALRFATELQLLIHGFAGACKGMMYASIMLWIVILLWSFIYVEVLNPVVRQMIEDKFLDSCPRCQIAYSSIFQAQLTIVQQIIAGDAWGFLTIDIIQERPGTAIIFIGSLITIDLVMMNLILTVIVDAAARAHNENENRILSEKENDFEKLKKKWIHVCEKLDYDGSGELSIKEMMKGLDESADFADMMAVLDITENDLHTAFTVMDEDSSGSVSYIEFVNNVWTIKKQNIETTLFFMRGHVNEVFYKLTKGINEMLTLQRQMQLVDGREQTLSQSDERVWKV